MTVGKALSLPLRALALLAIAFCANATPEASIGFSPPAIPASGTSTLVIVIDDTGTGGFTGGSISATYDPNVVNTGAVFFDSCGGTTVANVGANSMSSTNMSVAPFSSCQIHVQVKSSVAGTYPLTIGPGNPTASTGSNVGSTTATLTVVAPTVVTNTNDSGPGSLRDAINIVNGSCGLATAINFNIPTGPFVISPTTELPALNCGILLDGYSQPGSATNTNATGGNNAVIVIDLNGASCSGCNGLILGTNGIQVQGLAIHSFGGAAIVSNIGGGTNSIFGNYIGTGPGGMSAAGNGGHGITVAGGYAYIGDGSAAGRNLVTANTGAGILVINGAAQISGNQIGGLRDASAGAGNGNHGILLDAANYSSNTITGNLIIANAGAGILTSGTFTRVVVEANESFGNSGPGLDINDDGANANDDVSAPYDTDGVQNYPIVTAVSHVGGTTVVSGSLKSVANRSGDVFLYHNSSATGFNEGEKLISSATSPIPISTDASGNGTFTATVAGTWDNVSAQVTLDTCSDGCLRSSEYSPKFAAPAPAVKLSTASLSFGPQLNGTTSAPQTVTITNTGTGTLTISGLAVSASYSKATTCTGTLAAGASCDVNVTFTGPSTGTFPGTLTITSDAPGSPHTVSLSGTSAAPPTFAIATFTSRTPGQVSTVTVNIANPAGNTVTYSGFHVQLDYPAGFVHDGSRPVQTSCGAAVATVGSPTVTGIEAFGGSDPPGTACGEVSSQLFAPTTPGTYTFIVPAGGFTITSPFAYSNPSPITATVNVSPAPAPGVGFSPTTLSFASQTVGTSSASQAVTLTNTGNAALNVSSISTTGDFSQTNACPASIAAGGTCTINVTFSPSVAGPSSGTLSVASNASGSPHTVPLSGTGVATSPAVSLTPASLTFAPRTVSTTSPAQTVTLANTGNGPLTISSITISGDFAYSSSCGTSVAAGGSCTIDVTFTPLVAGARTGNLTVTDNAAGSPHIVSLGGTGLSGAAAVMNIAPSLVVFSPQQVGSASAPEIVTVSNSGTAPLTFSSIGITGEFSLVTPPGSSPPACPVTLSPGSSCQIALVFHPTGLNQRNGVLSIASNGGTATLNVRGTGLAAQPPQLTMASTLDFGTQPVGVPSAGHPLEIRNTSPFVASLVELTVTGDFAVSDTCLTIEAGAACSPLVTFQPSALGPRAGTLTVRTLRDANPYTVNLTGVGEENRRPALEIAPLRLGFGNTFLGQVVTRSVVLRNSGLAPLTISGIALTGDFFSDVGCIGSLVPGSTCTVRVTFAPGIPTGRNGVMTITSNAPGSPHLVDLSGTGCVIPSLTAARLGVLFCGP